MDYSKLLPTIQKLLLQYGRSISIQKRVRTPADPEKPWEGPAAWDDDNIPTGHSVETPGVFVGKGANFYSSGFGSAIQDVTGGLIRRDFDGFLCYSATDISDFNCVIDGAEIREVSAINVLKPGDTVLLYGIELAG